MAVTYRGLAPEAYYQFKKKELVAAINTEAAELERSLVKASPTGVGGGGGIRAGWSMLPASISNPVGVVDNNKRYFLPVELGRKPGKGISKQGQVSVARWAKLKLGLSPTQSNSLAYLLSQKYKREGRLAQGFAGLANEGDPARTVNLRNIEPVKNGIINQSFEELKRALNEI